MELSKLQENILDKNEKRVVVMAAAAAGKALSHGSKLYTVNGPIFIENAKIGDRIYGEDGNLHQIIGVFPQGKKKEYIITFSDRTQIKCCNEHLWTFQTESLRSKKSSTWITGSLQEIIDKYPLYKDARAKNNFGKGKSLRKNIFIPITQPIQFPEQKLKIEPYTMGALLGDGSFRNSIFTNEDKDILQWVNEELLLIGASLKYRDRYDYQINTNHKHIFSDILKQYNLWQTSSETKFIPNEYKYNSINNRLLLLQGLIDTDGYCEGSSYDLTLKSKQLILDCKEVCESLGLTATLSERRAICYNSAKGKKDCGIVYRLRIKTSKLFPKLHRSAKREKQWRPASVYSHRAIISIEQTNNEVEMTCITVDNPSKLFVTDNFIVTHNTALITEKTRQLLRSGVNPKEIAVITFTNMAAEELRGRLGEDYKDGIFIGTIHSLANFFLLSNGIDTKKVINDDKFDKLFKMVAQNPHCIKKINYLLLDEAQDSDDLQFSFLFDMIDPENFFVVGDLRQCQPAGTKIMLRNNIEKKIEDILPGDSIVYYDEKGGRCSGKKDNTYNAITKKVLKVSSRNFINDNLITIISESGKVSTYTPNHRTYVKLNDIGEKQILYLMCDNNYRFRVGQVPLFYSGGNNNGHGCNAWRTKMKNEGCTKIWLLKYFDSKHEASVEEQKVSYQYSIPQTCWQVDKVKWTLEDIDYIYSELDIKNSADKCLKKYGLDINFPLLDLDIDWMKKNHYTTNATCQVYASNLMPNYMSCVVYDDNINNHANKKFENINNVIKKYITDSRKVYSLKVEGGNYIADGIVTHNSIYGWSGSKPELLEELSRRRDVSCYSLNENYRNSKNILAYAKRGIQKNGLKDDSIPMREDDGLVKEIQSDLEYILLLIERDKNYKNWAILARKNDQVYQIINKLKEVEIPYDTFKQGDLKKGELSEKLKNNTVKILTIHSAKGLEWDNVAVVGAQYYNKEELNVNYVAATRARNVLFWVSGFNSKKKKRYF